MKVCNRCSAISPDNRKNCFLCFSPDLRAAKPSNEPAAAAVASKRGGRGELSKAGDFLIITLTVMILAGLLHVKSGFTFTSVAVRSGYMLLLLGGMVSTNKKFQSFVAYFFFLQMIAGLVIVVLIAAFIILIIMQYRH